MNRDDIIRMAREAGLGDTGVREGFIFFQPGTDGLERFAALVAAAEREKLAAWMMRQGYALEWQIKEREREACAKLCEAADKSTHPADLADAIRARK